MNATARARALCVCGAPVHRPTWGCVNPRPDTDPLAERLATVRRTARLATAGSLR